MEDLEVYLEIVSVVYAVVGMYGNGYILHRFAKPFMENKKGTFCIGITYFVTMLVLYFEPVQINTFVAYGLGILSAFIVMYRMDRRNDKQKIFIAVTFFSLRWLSECMTRIITEAIYHIKTVYNAFFLVGGNPVTQLMIFSGVELLDRIIEFVILGISVRYIVKTYVYKREDMSIKEMFISNSFTGNLKWDEERGLPVTSKEKTDGHGYGLPNIRMVARKYSGDIAIDLQDDAFRLSIMLMME